MKHELICMVICLVVASAFSARADGQLSTIDSKSIDQQDPAVSILATSVEGGILCERSMWVGEDQQWSMSYSGDPISMEYPPPLSTKDIAIQLDLLETLDDPDSFACSGRYVAVLKHSKAITKCPFPLYPNEELYFGSFESGAELFIRLPECSMPEKVIARSGDEVIELASIEPLALAKRMLAGDEREVDSILIEDSICKQECANLIAFHNKTNQVEELEASAVLVAKLLDLYNERHGSFPGQLCQLYTGENAVCGGLLQNPFKIQDSLCLSDFTIPKALGALKYFPRIESVGGETTVTGYWLAVLGQGKPIDPVLSLPLGSGIPLRAIRWIENHPGDQ